jgi:hypothetical protein
MTRERYPKPAECVQFVWWRRVKGPRFHWKHDPRAGELLVGPPNEALQPYEPLREETGLFLTFAHLDETAAEFLGFANTYGRLGTYYNYYPDHGEPLEEWQRHHRWIHFLVKQHGELHKDRPDLGGFVSWEGTEVLFRFPKLGTSANQDWRHTGELRLCPQSARGVPLFRPPDLAGPASWFLVYAIEDWLREIEQWRKPIATRLVWLEPASRPQLVFSPSSLLGAMVYQFAAALHRASPFRECARCHKFFRLEPGVNRANRLTCSTTCRQYLHNQRVQSARELDAAGRTVPQIVKELHVKPRGGRSGVDIVKNWIGRK